MGIQYLNSYFRTHCGNQALHHVHLSELSGKTIAVDISIYLYKYETDNTLLENMYRMLATFRHHNILPLFVFDGKPPPEKYPLLQQRALNKKAAQAEYDKLITAQKEEGNAQKLAALKRQCIRISKEKSDLVKELIKAFGATYYNAPGEADELCAMLVKQGKAWACLTEDMDLFVYGCPRVLKYLSLLTHSAYLYLTDRILQELQMNERDFQDICVLSGTDYDDKKTKTKTKTKKKTKKKNSLEQMMDYFRAFQKASGSGSGSGSSVQESFCDWLSKNTTYKVDLEQLTQIKKMFVLDEQKTSEAILVMSDKFSQADIETIMEKEDFIFPPPSS